MISRLRTLGHRLQRAYIIYLVEQTSTTVELMALAINALQKSSMLGAPSIIKESRIPFDQGTSIVNLAWTLRNLALAKKGLSCPQPIEISTDRDNWGYRSLYYANVTREQILQDILNSLYVVTERVNALEASETYKESRLAPIRTDLYYLLLWQAEA